MPKRKWTQSCALPKQATSTLQLDSTGGVSSEGWLEGFWSSWNKSFFLNGYLWQNHFQKQTQIWSQVLPKQVPSTLKCLSTGGTFSWGSDFSSSGRRKTKTFIIFIKLVNEHRCIHLTKILDSSIWEHVHTQTIAKRLPGLFRRLEPTGQKESGF